MPDTGAMPDLEGRMLGGCRLLRRLGSGGMGEVYLAEQMRLRRLVAVKVVRLDEATGPTGDPSAVERRFMDEGGLLAQFAHPNILPIHDSGIANGYLYLVMQ